MKKKIAMSSAALLGLGMLAFLLLRTERTLQRQQQLIRDLSARAARIGHRSASTASSEAGNDDFWNLTPPNFAQYRLSASEATADNLRAEIDRLRRDMANLQAKLDEVQKRSGWYSPGRAFPNGDAVNNNHFKVMPNAVVAPYSQVPAAKPRDWVPFEFNGVTYYRIPLAVAE